MDYEKMEAGPEMDYLIAVKIMKFNTGKYFKNGGGTYPSDAKKVRHGKNAWDAHAEGGTYPYLLKSGTIFWQKKGFGDVWEPSRDIRQAFMVASQVGLFSKTRMDRLYHTWRICGFTKAGHEYIIAMAESPQVVICRAALVGMAQKR